MMKKFKLIALSAVFSLPGLAQQNLLPTLPQADQLAKVERVATTPASPLRDLSANEWYVGYYTGNDIDYSSGLAQGGSFSAGTLMYPSVFADYAGCKVVGIRFAIGGDVEKYQTNGSRVFIQEVANNYYTDDVVSKDIEPIQLGWNEVRFPEGKQYTLPTDGTTALIVGFDFEQHGSDMPLVFCQGGTTGYNYVFIPNGQNRGWNNIGTSTTDAQGNTVYLGNLAIQLIVEKMKPQIDASLRTVGVDKRRYKARENFTYGFILKNTGTKKLSNYTVKLTLDGNDFTTYQGKKSLPMDGYDTVYVQTTVPEELNTGAHQLQFTITSLDGNEMPPSAEATRSVTFSTYEATMSRQKTLMEHHTSNTCTWCPQGADYLKQVANQRNDLAWVAIHGNMYATDPNNTAQGDSIESYEGLVSFPRAAYNRVYVPELAGQYATNAYSINMNVDDVPDYISKLIDYTNEMAPCFVRLSIHPIVVQAQHLLTLTVEGNGVEHAAEMLANNALFIYLTEDGLHGNQKKGSQTVANYEWNHVFRAALGKGVCGNNITWDGDNFSMVFRYQLDEKWNADKMHAIAFVGPKIDYGYTAVNEQIIDNCEIVPLTSTADGVEQTHLSDNLNELDIVDYYNLQGQQVDNPKKGVYLVKYANGTTKKLIIR